MKRLFEGLNLIIVYFIEISLALSFFSVSYEITSNLYLPLRAVLIFVLTAAAFLVANVILHYFLRKLYLKYRSYSLFLITTRFYVICFELFRKIFFIKDGYGMPVWFYKLFGLKCGKNCWTSGHILEPFLVEMGDNVRIGYDAVLTSHMFERVSDSKTFGKIRIGSNVLIGGRVLVPPGTVIEDNVIIAFGAVIPKNSVLKKDCVYAGIPAKKIKSLK